MNPYHGQTLSCRLAEGVLELDLHRDPCNEIGSATLDDLERFAEALDHVETETEAGREGSAAAVIIFSSLQSGFSAGADLRELHERSQKLAAEERLAGLRNFLERIHRVFNRIDASPLTTIAAVHGVTFGGGFELALTCDIIVADKMARFCFPELRLGLVPGFGGIPRLKRDLGNAVVRDLLLTGRSINAAKAQQCGLVSQLAGEGEALRVARSTAAQLRKFDRATSAAAKQFIKPVPYDDLRREIQIFCDLFTRPAVEAGLRKFVEDSGALPYLP